MVPSALRIAALPVLAAAATLFALPASLQSGSPERANARPAAAHAALAPLVPIGTFARTDAASVRTPERHPDAAVRTPAPQTPAYSFARVRSGRSVALRSAPGGAVVARLGSRTEFGSARALAVAEVRGRWLGVLAPELPNGHVGWIDSRSDTIAVGHTQVSLRADLSRRTLELRVGGRVVKRMTVAIGRPGSSTPVGRFAVTDKLSGGNYGPYYGCCILALSGHQPNTPAGWQGGNRLAIHGTNSPGTIGARASAGCLRGDDADLRTLMRRVPVGAPVFIRR
jgi:hypothetical protein